MLRLVAALVIPALLVGAQAPAAKPPAQLTFAWPAGVNARVDVNLQRFRQNVGETGASTSWRTSYTMRTEPSGDGVRVRYADPIAADVTAALKAGFGDQLAVRPPSMLVDRAGKFTALDGLAEYKAAGDKLAMGLAQAESTFLSPDLRQLMAVPVTDATLQAAAGRAWSSLVQNWIGTPVDRVVFDTKGSDAAQLMPATPVPTTAFVRLTRHRNCTRAAAAQDCVTIEARYRFDAAALNDALTKALSTPRMAGLKIEKHDATALLVLTLETATMLPHRYDLTRDLDVAVTTTQGGRTAGRQRTQLSQVFTYK